MKKNRKNRINEFIDKLDDALLSEEQSFYSVGGVVTNNNCSNKCVSNDKCPVNSGTCPTNLCSTNTTTCLYLNPVYCNHNGTQCGK